MSQFTIQTNKTRGECLEVEVFLILGRYIINIESQSSNIDTAFLCALDPRVIRDLAERLDGYCYSNDIKDIERLKYDN